MEDKIISLLGNKKWKIKENPFNVTGYIYFGLFTLRSGLFLQE